MTKNIVLIGMPNSGKTCIGKVLAEELDMSFIDIDHVIKEKTKKNLRDLVNEDGLETFLNIQKEIILELNLKGFVIATGGSVIYSRDAMEHLKKNGIVIFLKIPFEFIEKRSIEGRRFARLEGQTISEMFKERQPLYARYADFVVDCGDRNKEELAEEIEKMLEEASGRQSK